MKHFTRTWLAVVVLLQLHLSTSVRGDFTTLQFGGGTPGQLQPVAQSNSYTLRSGGLSIGGISDACSYHYITNTGIFGSLDFSACVRRINPALAGETTGIMVRDGLADSARMLALGFTVNPGGATGTLRLLQRSTNGQPATILPPPPGFSTVVSLPYCLRIVRSGNLMFALVSTNGTNWQSYARIDTAAWRGGALPDPVYVGIAGVSSPAAATPPSVSLTQVNPGAPYAPYVTPLPDLVVDEDAPNPNVQFTLGDFESVFSVNVSAFSDNPALFPSNRLEVFGAGSGQGLFVRPAPNGHGEANVTLVVSDGVRTAQDSFHVTVNSVEDPPVLSNFPDLTIDEDTDSGPIAFTITDVDTPLDQIRLGIENGVPDLVPPGGFIFGGSGSNRTLTIKPNPNAFGGFFLINVTASDPSNTVKKAFVFKVNPVNDLPIVVPPADVAFANNTNSGFLPVRISDVETIGGLLKVFATSLNTNVIASTGIAFGGNTTNRTIHLTPVPGASGSTTITVFVVDQDTGTNSGTFNVTVTAPGVPLRIARQPASTNVVQGDPFTLDVEATSGNPITYQWRFNGTNIPNQTAARLTIQHAQAAHAGRYDVIVTSAGNHVTSQPADVTVSEATTAGTHDFGDAPDSYRTTLASNGARHLTLALQTGGQFVGLGPIVDLETNGVPSAGSDGDDVTTTVAGKDDEDAIRYLTALVPGQTSRVEVIVRGNLEFAFLNAWIDFDGDGTFAQAANRVFSGLIVSYGTNVLSFPVPANAAPGLTHSRFRLTGAHSTNSPLRSIDYFGEAPNGEVEDYPVTIDSTTPTGPGSHDFGDAPDSYRTTLASNGARHLTDALKPNSPYVTLGNRVDLESDGAAGIGATGDDLNDTNPAAPANADDEDGIRFLTPITPGQTSRVEVIVRGFSFEYPFLNAWIDFDFDGTFNPASDKIFNGRLLSFGTNTLSFLVPANAKPTNTYARFRLTAANSTNAPVRIVDFFGEASVGEVEDYQVTIENPPEVRIDFGDAPELNGQYPTRLASNGARHTIKQGFHLGKRVDAESDGQPEASARGDDKAGADDEDGIRFIGAIQPGKLASVEVTASADGMLDAWIDFNQNSIWGNADEKIFNSVPLKAGVQTLSFNVPTNAKLGQTFSRFRYSSQGGLDATGPAPDGEVEDYPVDLTAEEACDLSCAGVDFWLTFPGNYAPDPANPIVPSLRVVGSAGTTVKVRIPGLSTNINVVMAGASATITLPAGVDLGNLNDNFLNRGIHVTASQPVTLHALSYALYTSDGYTALPTEVTGREYIVSAYPNVHVGIPEISGSQFAVVACSNNTTVTITPSVETGLRLAGVPYSVVLTNAGDCYQLRNTNDAPADLTGTLIQSDQPVAVFGGHQCANINSRSWFFCDYLVEQMLPVNRWAAEFITVPLATRLNGDTFRILAGSDDTSVTIDATNTLVLASRGDVAEIILVRPAHIIADKPVFVAQFANSSDFDGVTNADPFMVTVPGRPHFSASQSFATPTSGFTAYYIGVVAPASVTQITLDGTVQSPAFVAVGTSGYHAATVSITPGAHTLTATQPVGVTVYGWGEYVSFAWSSCLFFGDTTAPVLQCPTNRIVTTLNPQSDTCEAPVPNLTAHVTYTDNCSFGAVTDVVQKPSAGSMVGVGTNRVTLSVTDAVGNTGYCYVDFIVLDGKIDGAYSLQCPKDRTVTCQTTHGAVLTYKVAGLRGCTPVSVECDPPSGSLFPRGTTKVNCRLPRPGLPPLECNFNVTVECRKRVGIQVKPAQIPGAPLEFNIDFDDQTSVLEVADSPEGPWIRIPAARTGYAIKVAQEKGKFFRTVEQ